MRPWIKRIAYGGGFVVVLVVVMVGVLYAVSESRFRRTYTVAAENIASSDDSATIARGSHLVSSIGCIQCHGDGMRGGAVIDKPPMGRIIAPNLTSGQGGLGPQLTPTVIEHAVRHGVGPDGHALRIMPSDDYQTMSDADMHAVVSYIKHLPPVDNALGPSRVMLLPRALLVAGVMPLLPAEHLDPARTPSTVTPGATKEYGYYLASLAGCTNCHGPGLSGGKVRAGDPSWPPAANLTRLGNLGRWSEAQFVNTLRTGIRPDGSPLNAPMSQAPRIFGGMTNDELHAIWLYLQSVPPRAYGNH